MKHRQSLKHNRETKAGENRSVSDTTINDQILNIGNPHDAGPNQAVSNIIQGMEGLILRTEMNTGSGVSDATANDWILNTGPTPHYERPNQALLDITQGMEGLGL